MSKTWGEISTPYLAQLSAVRKPSTVLSYKATLGIIPDDLELQFLTVQAILESVGASGHSKNTQRKDLTILKGCLRFAHDNNGLDQSEKDAIEAFLRGVSRFMPSATEPNRRWMNYDQVKIVLAAATPFEAAVVEILVKTGMRRAELFALRDEDVVRFGETLFLVDGRSFIRVFRGAKRDRFRQIPVSDRVVFLWDKIKERKKRWRHDSCIYELVRTAGRRAGMPWLKPHDLRRTFAQLHKSLGTHIHDIKDVMGHSKITTTEKYLDLDPEAGRAGAEAMDKEI